MGPAPPTELPRWDELRALVLRLAPAEGLNQTALPGVRISRFDRPQSWQFFSTPGLAIGVVVQGRKQTRAADQVLCYHPPQFLVLTGEQDFQSEILQASPESPYLSVGIFMPAEVVAETMIELGKVDDAPTGRAEPGPNAFVSTVDERLLGTVIRLLATAEDPAERRVLAPLVTRELVFRVLRSDAAASLRHAVGRDGNEHRIQQAMAFIREHAEQPLSVETLARRVAMSPSHFAHRFAAIARTSPMRYLKQVRLHRARALLVDGSVRASEAGERVGYSSPSHFSRDFKGLFGVPPGTFARRARSNFAGSDKTPAATALGHASDSS
ncbi:MAG: AraC family transcriptional regulator [Myxococcota bacterium]